RNSWLSAPDRSAKNGVLGAIWESTSGGFRKGKRLSVTRQTLVYLLTGLWRMAARAFVDYTKRVDYRSRYARRRKSHAAGDFVFPRSAATKVQTKLYNQPGQPVP